VFVPNLPAILMVLTEINGIQASPFKGNHQKFFPDFKLRPFKAQSIQNPKSKIEMTYPDGDEDFANFLVGFEIDSRGCLSNLSYFTLV
jgi:hypothetical protein